MFKSKNFICNFKCVSSGFKLNQYKLKSEKRHKINSLDHIVDKRLTKIGVENNHNKFIV